MKNSFIALTALAAIGCQSGDPIIGVWKLDQDNKMLGEGAENARLFLKDDQSFSIEMGTLTMLNGTYKFERDVLTLSAGTSSMGTTYKLVGKQFVPVVNGKDVDFWRWKR